MRKTYYHFLSESKGCTGGGSDIKTLFGVFVMLFRIYAFNKYPSEYKVTITQESGFELIEKREMHRLIKKYNYKGEKIK